MPAWFGDWFPAIATAVSIGIVTVAMAGGWPDFDAPPGSVTAEGFIVVIETDEDAAGEVTEIRVRRVAFDRRTYDVSRLVLGLTRFFIFSIVWMRASESLLICWL